MNAYIIATTLINLWLAVAWSRKSWLNISIKIGFWLLTFGGTYLIINKQLLG